MNNKQNGANAPQATAKEQNNFFENFGLNQRLDLSELESVIASNGVSFYQLKYYEMLLRWVGYELKEQGQEYLANMLFSNVEVVEALGKARVKED